MQCTAFLHAVGQRFTTQSSVEGPPGQPFLCMAWAHADKHENPQPQQGSACFACIRDHARASRELLQLAAQRFDLQAPGSTASSPAAVLASLQSYDTLLNKELQVSALAAPPCCLSFGATPVSPVLHVCQMMGQWSVHAACLGHLSADRGTVRACHLQDTQKSKAELEQALKREDGELASAAVALQAHFEVSACWL